MSEREAYNMVVLCLALTCSVLYAKVRALQLRLRVKEDQNGN